MAHWRKKADRKGVRSVHKASRFITRHEKEKGLHSSSCFHTVKFGFSARGPIKPIMQLEEFIDHCVRIWFSLVASLKWSRSIRAKEHFILACALLRRVSHGFALLCLSRHSNSLAA